MEHFEVLSTDGNAFLGGDDFDNRIIDWLAKEFKDENGFDVKKTTKWHYKD